MRLALLDATMNISEVLHHWVYSVYWQHPYNVDPYSDNDDTGWFDDEDLEDNRRIRTVGNSLLNNLLNNAKVWIPAQSQRDIGEDIHIMRCGWMYTIGQDVHKWGAIWRYKNNEASYWSFGNGYPTTFTVPESGCGGVMLHKYNPTSDSWETLTTSPIDPQQDGVTYNIPSSAGGKYVNDENPTFLEFGY